MSKKDAIVDSAKIAREWINNGTPYSEFARRYQTSISGIHYIIKKNIKGDLLRSVRRLHLSRSGKNFRWEKGHEPWNKGIHFDAGGRSHETRFKPGHIRGSAAQRYKAVGSITIRHWLAKSRGIGRRRKIPYRWIKIKDDGPPQYCWIQYARYVYEKYVGPIPPGFFPIHKDGDTLNDEPSNLVLVDRAGNLSRNGHNPAARARAIMSRIETCRQRREKKAIIKEVSPELLFYPRANCPSCGWSSNNTRPPERCPKCGYGSIETLKKKIA